MSNPCYYYSMHTNILEIVMRMWNIDPKKLCAQHLLGEHVEMHMLVGTLNKGKSVKGFIENKLIEVHNIKSRHDELVQEMNRRGYKHKSPLPEYDSYFAGKVDKKESEKELKKRCDKCFVC